MNVEFDIPYFKTSVADHAFVQAIVTKDTVTAAATVGLGNRN